MLAQVLKPKNRLALIIAAGILVRILAAFLLGNSVTDLPGISDQISYHQLALRVLAGHGFSFDKFWWPYPRPGEPTVHWSYLFTLALVAVYEVIGVYPVVMRLLQAVLSGWLMTLLAYRLAGRLFDEKVALVAAAGIAFYGYFIYYGVALMTESFYLICVLWALDATLRLGDELRGEVERPPEKKWLGLLGWVELGVAILLAALLRQLFLLFAPFLFLWLGWVALSAKSAAASAGDAAATSAETKPTWLQKLWPVLRGAVIVGVVLVVFITPITLFNYRRFGRVVLINTNAGFAFFWANHPIYGNQFIPVLDTTQGEPAYQELIPPELRSLNEAELDGALLQRGLGFVVQDPVRYLRLSLSRIPIYFMFWPSADSGLLSNIVRVASFGLALPFMVIGLWLWLREPAKSPANLAAGVLLLLFVVVYSAIHILSWTLIRYRLPVDAVLLIFASKAVVSGAVWVQSKLRLGLPYPTVSGS